MNSSLDILRRCGFAAGPAAALAAALLFGCSENAFIGTKGENGQPQMWLLNGPADGAVVSYQVHFYWKGWDEDGSIAYYEFILAERGPSGFDPQDTTGIDAWHRTAAHDTLLKARADANPENIRLGGWWYTRYEKEYTFFIRAVDDEGKRSEPIARSFTAWTLAPYVVITAPRDRSTGVALGRVVKIRWEGIDPIDSPGNCQRPDSVRYLSFKHDPAIDVVADLNAHPELYEDRWSRWRGYRAAQDSGSGGTIIGDDEVLDISGFYTFAIQAKDDAGAVTRIFDRMSNVLQFWLEPESGPLLTVTESFSDDTWQFTGMHSSVGALSVLPGASLHFCWEASAESYGGAITAYRYGWDVTDVNDDAAWETLWAPDFHCAPEKTFFSGLHRFYIQVRDNSDTRTLGIIEVSVGGR